MSQDNTLNNKRIAKNTLYLYARMLVTMFVSLFTTRINFQALGIDNFGIYNVVGSIIVFFTFINSGLTTATRRYITAELAQGDEESQRNVFNLSQLAHVFVSLIIVVLGETVGSTLGYLGKQTLTLLPCLGGKNNALPSFGR